MRLESFVCIIIALLFLIISPFVWLFFKCIELGMLLGDEIKYTRYGT